MTEKRKRRPDMLIDGDFVTPEVLAAAAGVVECFANDIVPLMGVFEIDEEARESLKAAMTLTAKAAKMLAMQADRDDRTEKADNDT